MCGRAADAQFAIEPHFMRTSCYFVLFLVYFFFRADANDPVTLSAPAPSGVIRFRRFRRSRRFRRFQSASKAAAAIVTQ